MFGSDDLEALLEDSPHTLTVGDVTAACWFSSSDELVLATRGIAAHLSSRSAVAQVVATDFPYVKSGDGCTVTEVDPDTGAQVSQASYTIYTPRKIHDGAMLELILNVA